MLAHERDTFMTTKQIRVSNPLLPTALRRVDAHDDGSITLHLDTEDHDKQLLRSVGDALRNQREVADLFRTYADLMDRLDLAERTDDHDEQRVLTDEAEDVLSEIETVMEWGTPGEGLAAHVNTHDTETLASALVYAVAEHLNDTQTGVVRDLAVATGRTA